MELKAKMSDEANETPTPLRSRSMRRTGSTTSNGSSSLNHSNHNATMSLGAGKGKGNHGSAGSGGSGSLSRSNSFSAEYNNNTSSNNLASPMTAHSSFYGNKEPYRDYPSSSDLEQQQQQQQQQRHYPSAPSSSNRRNHGMNIRGDGYGGGGHPHQHGHGHDDDSYSDGSSYDEHQALTPNSFDDDNNVNNDDHHRNNHNHNKGPKLRPSTKAASATASANNTSHIQSHNYEPDESEVWRAYVAQQHFRNRGQWWTTGKKRALNQWMLTMLIGIIQAFLAFGCNLASRGLSEFKYETVYQLMEGGANDVTIGNDTGSSTSGSGSGSGSSSSSSSMSYSTTGDDLYDSSYAANVDNYNNPQNDSNESSNNNHNNMNSSNTINHISFLFGGSPFLAFVFLQTTFALIASFFVWLEPVSGGSGIPEIKCFLNGIDLPRVVRIKTLICKVIGVTFSVAAGLPVGKEGPMVHSGAVVAAGVSQGRTKFWGVDTSFSKYSDFRNDREKRDFIACGAAAGVASAFGAPIGGVLFSLEEGASYWSTKLTWRAFFCAMITLGTLFALRNLDNWWGQANMEKLFSFGEFNSLTGEASNFAIWELLIFMMIGCLGGLIGAVFNSANEHLTIWRMKNVNYSKKRRIMEVFVVSLIVTFVSYAMPRIWNRCTERPTDMQDWSNQEKKLVDALVRFECEENQYNEVASLIFTDADTAIKQLFHFREAGMDDASTFSSAALFLFFVPYISMATLVYGIAVPSGLFVPSLLSGAAFGRLCGHLLHKLDHTSGTFADSGTYALMGAAAVLGGMARMTISLTVILLEATGDMQYVLPLMLTLMCARFTGNVFNEGLYDIHIKLKNIPFLEPEVPSIAEKHDIVAGQVMSTDVKCLRPVERAGVVYDLLRTCSHGTFPIVDTASSGTLYGTASRHMLCTLLQRRAFGSPDNASDYEEANMTLGPKRLSPLVQWDTIERVYPRYPMIDDVDMRSTDRNCLIDLRPYANTAPYTVNETASIQRTYRLFRTLGLRFLCVVNHNNQVVGIITRKDLLPESISDSLLRGRNPHRYT